MGYQLGQEILPLEEPFSHVVNYKYRSKFCDWCIQAEKGSEVKLKKCTSCEEVYYCNRDCQQKAYTTYHRKECKKLKTIPSFIASERRDVLILMGRTITKIQNGGDQVLWQYGLWSFQMGDTKLKSFLPKNQHTQRKLLNSSF